MAPLLLLLAMLAVSFAKQPVVTLSHHVEEVTESMKPGNTEPKRKTQMFQFLDSEPPTQEHMRSRRDVITPPLQLYQSYPNELESTVVGPVINPIYPGTPAFDALSQNYNSNPNIYWYNTTTTSFPHLGNKRIRSLVDTLATLVTTYFNYTVPIHLVVISGYVVPPPVITLPDTRYEGRAVHISVQAQNANYHTAVASNLQGLSNLAWDAGFDFIQFYAVDYLHVSTIADGCLNDLDLAFLLDGSGSVGSDGFSQALQFINSLSNFFTISPAHTRVSVTTYDGPRSSQFSLWPNSTDCPSGSIWEASGQGCICPQNSGCSGPQYNQFSGPFSGCRAGQYELVPGACAGSNQPGWIPAQHPNCQYPREFFDHNCTLCACTPWGPAFDPNTASQANILFSSVSSYAALSSAVSAIPYPNGASMLSLGLQRVMTEVFNVSNGMRPASAGVPRVLVVLSDGKSQNEFGPEPTITQLKSELGVTVFAIGIGSPYLPELQEMASSPYQRYLFQSPDISQLPTLIDQLSTGICSSTSNVVPGTTTTGTLNPGDTMFYATQCAANVPIMTVTLTDPTGNTQLFISTTNSNPSIADNTQSDTSSNPVKTLVVNRQASSGVLPVYIGTANSLSNNVTSSFQLVVSQGVFANSFQSFSVPQSTAVNSAIDTFPSTVSPSGYTPVYGFLLSTSGNTNGTFTVDSNTGILFLAKIPNFSVQKSFLLTRYATDSNVPCLTGSQTINVTFYDNSDHAPVFNPTTYTASYTELVGPGYNSRRSTTFPASLVTVTATGQGTGVSLKVSYFLYQGDPTLFSVDPVTGIVYVLQNLQFSIAPSYLIQIGARSGGGAATNASTSANVTVTVIYVPTPPYIPISIGDNGYIPVTTSSNPGNGTIVSSFPIANPSNQTFTCYVTGSKMFIAYATNNSCILITNGTVNPPTDTTFMVNVTVKDSRNTTETVPVGVLVPGQDLSVPTFHPSALSVYVALNEPILSTIARLNVTDGTKIPMCNISSGNDLGIFTINQLGSCVITIAQSPNVATSASLANTEVVLSVTASDGQFSSTASVTIIFYDGCSSFSCPSGYACPQSAVAYNCTCIGAATAPCINQVNYCVSASSSGNPCLYNSTCTNVPGTFKCQCASGLTGSTCAIGIDYCATHPCHDPSHGTCVPLATSPGFPDNSYTCDCNAGYYGSSCQFIDNSPNLCVPNPCEHGTCYRAPSYTYGPLDNYKCACNANYTGINCTDLTSFCFLQNGTDLCNPSSGSSCVPSPTGGFCNCSDTVTGTYCNVNVPDACSSQPCENGGTCVSTLGPSGKLDSFECMCIPPLPSGFMYGGTYCNESNANCIVASASCSNGGTCGVTPSGGECACAACFSGPDCNVPDTTSPGCTAAATNSNAGAIAGIVVAVIASLIIVVLLLLVLLRRRRAKPGPAPMSLTVSNDVSINQQPGDSLSNPMYGMVGGQSQYDSIATPSQATYDSGPARDGGYMTVVRPAPAGGASNPLYAQTGALDENYGGQPNQARQSSIDSRQFAVENGRLRVASVARTNPLNDGMNNPMYHEAQARGSGNYDTPLAVNKVFGVPVEESTTEVSDAEAGYLAIATSASHGYDSVGTRGAPEYDTAQGRASGYDAAGRNGSNGYDAAGRNGVNGYDAVGRGGFNGYDAAGRSGNNQYDAAGKNGSSEYDVAGKNGFNGYDAAGRNGANGYDAAGRNGVNGYDAVGRGGFNGYDAAGKSGNSQYDAAGKNGSSEYDVAGKNGFNGYDAAGRNGVNGYDAVGRGGFNGYDAAGKSGNNQYDAAGKNGSSEYDVAGRNGFNGYDAAGRTGFNGYDAAGKSGNNQYDAAGKTGVNGYDAVSSRNGANQYDAANARSGQTHYDSAKGGNGANHYDAAGRFNATSEYDSANARHNDNVYDAAGSTNGNGQTVYGETSNNTYDAAGRTGSRSEYDAASRSKQDNVYDSAMGGSHDVPTSVYDMAVTSSRAPNQYDSASRNSAQNTYDQAASFGTAHYDTPSNFTSQPNEYDMAATSVSRNYDVASRSTTDY